MKLDEFDSHVLSQKDKPAIDIMNDVYGVELAKSNAEKQLAGIRRHLNFKKTHTEEDVSIPDKRKYGVDKSGVQVREKLVLLSEDDMQDAATILQKMGLDPVQWELLNAEFDAKSWDVTMKLYQKNKDGRQPDKVHQETNWGYSCKIRTKPTETPITLEDFQSVLQGITIPAPKTYKYTNSGLMWEMPLMDIHMGKLAWAEQTGEDNYDVKIAGARSRKTVEDFLSKAGTYEKILFPVGQDFFHVDNISNETSAGTRMDVEGRWEKLYREGVEFLVWAVAELRRLAPVDIFYVPGNHDKMLSYCAVVTLAHAYAKASGVTVDLSPTTRKYRSFGKCMVGFSHGKEGKRIEKLMQVEDRGAWGKSLWNEFHLGDKHHERVWEEGGIIFRRISSITSADAWHADSGFVGVVRKAQAFEWDKELGLVNIQNSVVKDSEQ